MGIFQCQVCGCSSNTADGWFHSRYSESLNKPEDIGIAKCSVCAPQTFPSGEDNKKFDGTWKSLHPRRFLPHGEFFTNEDGNIEHVISGLIGNEAYKVYARDEMYPKEMDVYPVPPNPRYVEAKKNKPSKGRVKKDKQKARRK